MRYSRFLGITAFCIFVDQGIKYYMRNALQYDTIAVFDILGIHFDLRLAFNKGVGFSLLSSSQQTPLILLSLLLILILFVWLKRCQDMGTAVGLSLMLGGAIGNVIDRVVLGGVVDFLRFYYATTDTVYAFPTFNVADMCITFGVVCILWQDIFAKFRKNR